MSKRAPGLKKNILALKVKPYAKFKYIWPIVSSSKQTMMVKTTQKIKFYPNYFIWKEGNSSLS